MWCLTTGFTLQRDLLSVSSSRSLSFLFSFFSYIILFIWLLSLAYLCVCVFLCVYLIVCMRRFFSSRCFGLLLSPGKNVKNSDMHLLDLVGDCFHMCVCVVVCVCVYLCACTCVCVCLLTSSNLCPFRNQWEKAQTGSLTSSQEAGTPTRLSFRLWMRKHPKVTAKNLSNKTEWFSTVIISLVHILLIVWLFIHSYIHTNMWHIPKCLNHSPTVPWILKSSCKEQWSYGVYGTTQKLQCFNKDKHINWPRHSICSILLPHLLHHQFSFKHNMQMHIFPS